MPKKPAKTAKASPKGEKVILLYSGGLDTSVIVRWLADKGYRVVCVTIDVGQQESLDLEQKALASGAVKFLVRDTEDAAWRAEGGEDLLHIAHMFSADAIGMIFRR